MGATAIPRAEYLDRLEQALVHPGVVGSWRDLSPGR
jgi:hypothetical protein